MERLRAAGCVFAEDEARLLTSAASGSVLESLVQRRIAGEPLEHLLGWVEFAGLRLAVGPGVFVPRQRTTLMARVAVQNARVGGVLVELCCGIAPVACAALAAVPSLTVAVSDIDPVAVRYAVENLAGRGVALVGDLDSTLPDELRGRVDVLACNTPYVPSSAIAGLPPEARNHEPLTALDGGPDGLDIQRRLAAVAADWLAPDGCVLVEVGEDQAETSAALFERAGLISCVVHDEELGATVVQGRQSARPVV